MSVRDWLSRALGSTTAGKRVAVPLPRPAERERTTRGAAPPPPARREPHFHGGASGEVGGADGGGRADGASFEAMDFDGPSRAMGRDPARQVRADRPHLDTLPPVARGRTTFPNPTGRPASRPHTNASGAASPVLHGEGRLGATGLQKSYGGRAVVKDVGLTVARGEAVGLLGPNGAGKTTVFYMVTGLVPADAGSVTIDGRDVTRLPMYRRARLGIGYLPQEASIFRGLTVEQNIMAVLELVEPNRKRRREQLERLLEEFDIARLRKSPSIALSGGERRRCEIARALATRPSYILLDEPFAGIDPIAVGDIQQLVRHLKRRGIGVLITDHNVRETLSLIDRAYIIYDGRVLTEGNPEEIIANEDVRRVYLGDMFD
jgi:lipopolysaccharide export system ATP-binding protein